MKKLAKTKRNREALRELSGDEVDKVMTKLMKSTIADLRSCPKEELVVLDEALEKMLSSSKWAKDKRFLQKFKKDLEPLLS